MTKIKQLSLSALLAVALAFESIAYADSSVVGETLSKTRARSVLTCGVGSSDPGFAQHDVSGEWTGFDVDFCRAIAAATLGDAQAVEYVTLDSLNRLRALQNGSVDVLLRTTTWTYSRDTTMGLDFAGTVLFDTQGILVHKNAGTTIPADLKGKTICANRGTTSLGNLKEFVTKAKIDVTILALESQEGRWRAFFNRECDAITADKSDLRAKVSTLVNGVDKYQLLEADISNEPLGVVVRDDDRQWFDIVKWVVMATIAAEEQGMTSENAQEYAELFQQSAADKLGLKPDWVFQVISQVGNYEEIFERNVGQQSSIRLERGLNRLYSEGGLLYAMPFR